MLTLIAITGSSSKITVDSLTANAWKFKSAVSEDLSTSHYLSTIYEGARYHFKEDNNFTGSFFSQAVSGTWDVSNDTLYLNKGTAREEMYTYMISREENLILTATERGSKVHISFVKE
jgi:hypothetical protein